jgi:hypothetical protein
MVTIFERVNNAAPQEEYPPSTTKNSSYFTLYNDGIGFNGYSVRLSNFSFNNIPKNLALLTGLTINIGVAAESLVTKKCFTVVNTLNEMNHLFYYCVEARNYNYIRGC